MWLKNWAEVNQDQNGNPNVGKYIGIYFALGVSSAALVVVQTLILWIFCSIEVRQHHCHYQIVAQLTLAQASRKLHERMATAMEVENSQHKLSTVGNLSPASMCLAKCHRLYLFTQHRARLAAELAKIRRPV